MTIIKCITAEIYKPRNGDCSNGGISSRFDEVLIPVEGGNIEVDADDPPENLVRIVRRHLFGRDCVHVEPWSETRWCVFGGTFVDGDDGRFDRTIDNGGYPVKLHDRVEEGEIAR